MKRVSPTGMTDGVWKEVGLYKRWEKFVESMLRRGIKKSWMNEGIGTEEKREYHYHWSIQNDWP